jgi:hypothetical protein
MPGEKRQQFMLTSASAPNAATASASGFSRMASRYPSIETEHRAKEAIRSAGMLLSAIRASRSKSATPGPERPARPANAETG